MSLLFWGMPADAMEPPLDGLQVSDLSYWVEPEGEALTWQQALNQAQWHKNKGEFNLGYTQKKVWVSQDIHSLSEENWVLHIPYPLLDYIDVYLLENNQIITQLHSGDLRLFNTRLVKVPDFILGLATEEYARYKLLVRIETKGTMMMPLVWRTETRFAEHLAQQQLIYGAYYGVLIVMALYHLFIFLVVREKSYLLYVCSLTAFVFLQLSFDGRGFAWLWPQFPQLNGVMFPLSYCLYQLAIFTFMAEFLQLRKNSPYLNRYFIFLRLMVFIYLGLIYFLPYGIIVPIIVVTSILGIISGLLASAYLWFKGFTAARYFTCAWLMFLGGILLVNFRGWGLGDASWLTQYGYLLGSLFEVLLLAFSLADRINTVNMEKRQVEKDLINSQNKNLANLKRYQQLYEHAPVGNFQSDKHHQLISVNQACAKIFGFNSPQEMLGNVKGAKTYLKSNFEAYRDVVRSAIKHNKVSDQELLINDEQGKEVWISLSMRYTEGDNSAGFEGVIVDISARKNAEKLNRELDQERLMFMEKFSLGIAQQIHTPLGSNVATTAFIREGLDDLFTLKKTKQLVVADYDDVIELIQQSFALLASNQARITLVIKRFRDISAQHLALKGGRFNLKRVIDETVDSQRWKMAGWRVNVACASDVYMVSYQKAISVILTQLMDNVIEHSGAENNQDPIIWIRGELNREGHVTIVVTDNGQGIQKEQVKSLCQPFFTTKTGIDGHIGLGLYMVYNLVNRALNGRLHFPVTGTGFCVQLNIAQTLKEFE
jgi:PAS domain S-box-containing protein